MIFNNATINFHSTMTAQSSQFYIDTTKPVEVSILGPNRYTYLQLDDKQTQAVNELAKGVGIAHEQGPSRNRFMVYTGTFLPTQVTVADSSCDATLEEKEVFGRLFEIAASSIAIQMGWAVNPDDVQKILLNAAVDFNFIEAPRAYCLSIELSPSAADRLNIDKDPRFQEYFRGDLNEDTVWSIVYPGQS